MYIVRKKCGDELSFDAIPVPQEQYWAAFPDKAAAIEHAIRLDRAEILINGIDTNPINRGIEPVSSLPEPVFCDWLMEAGIEPPAPVKDMRSAWRAWWDRVVTQRNVLTRNQLAHLLEGLDRLPLQVYEVEEVESVDEPTSTQTVYAVVDSFWRYNDATFDGANKGLKVYRTKHQALAERDRLASELAERERRLNARDPGYRNSREDKSEYVVVELLLDPDRIVPDTVD